MTRPLEQVSVAALVGRAGIARATFYLHHRGLEALAVDACAGLVREAVDALHAWRGVPDPVNPLPALLGFFAGAADHVALYRALLTPGGGGPLGGVLHRELRERSRSERALAGAPEPDLVASAVAATFAGTLADWAHGLIDATPDRIAHLVWRLLVALHRTPVGGLPSGPAR
ncbi:TetR/AcrR family transcriptional regulator [Streptomyces sp. 549]|uniref:TetR/AcrR family transcriptional regulator n=1 Tax=Streptomyces sp. 549 TaxID=3049076 RepID=UPI0024C2C65C|nr:TetR/AcrR family transcriptional regulator [Streptomyces sp. 549]MDK1474546.1 TetR/AcrR family transcriptional regulator [Streptomyces sp. 549]